ncbi:MAG: hypothetical protein H0U99_02515 [Chthoniobacterales bacterium]|nr:hypothetical protein [Chthoniobacterales bacterium]
MNLFRTLAVLLALGSVAFADDLKAIDSFGAAAAKNGALLIIPRWERTPVAYLEKDAQTGPSQESH